MTPPKRALILALSALAVGSAAAAETFPSRPITIVVPYPAGGTSDVQLRMIQEPLQRLLGQPVIIDNKPGASGAIAAKYVASAKPTGTRSCIPTTACSSPR